MKHEKFLRHKSHAMAALAASLISLSPAMADDSNAFKSFDAKQWSQLDWETDQRIKRMTREELPALQRRAREGDLHAATLVGIALRDGIDRGTVGSSVRGTIRMDTNNTAALEWLRKAAESGYPMAQVELGEMYYSGHGVVRDLSKAEAWMKRAAEHDYPRANMNLAQIRVLQDPGADTIGDLLRSAVGATRQMY